MCIKKVNSMLDQFSKSQQTILDELNKRNDLDIKTVIMKARQLEDYSAKITTLVMLKSK